MKVRGLYLDLNEIKKIPIPSRYQNSAKTLQKHRSCNYNRPDSKKESLDRRIHCLVAAMLIRCHRSFRCPGTAADLWVSSGVRVCAPNS